IALAASDRDTARRLYPRPCHSRITSAREARASAVTLGNRFRKRRYAGRTRVAWVCCSMNSLTRTRYGSGRTLHGYAPRLGSYQRSNGARFIDRNHTGVRTSTAPAGETGLFHVIGGMTDLTSETEEVTHVHHRGRHRGRCPRPHGL